MRTLRIEAASLGSARGFQKALTGLGCELQDDDTGYFSVKIPIQTDRDIVAILRALERHVAGDGYRLTADWQGGRDSSVC
jgi:hypothetical protein